MGKMATHTDPFILPASWLLGQKSREAGNGNAELFRVTVCSACLGAQPTLLTVYGACYSSSAILPSAQLSEVQPNVSPGSLILNGWGHLLWWALNPGRAPGLQRADGLVTHSRRWVGEWARARRSPSGAQG